MDTTRYIVILKIHLQDIQNIAQNMHETEVFNKLLKLICHDPSILVIFYFFYLLNRAISTLIDRLLQQILQSRVRLRCDCMGWFNCVIAI